MQSLRLYSVTEEYRDYLLQRGVKPTSAAAIVSWIRGVLEGRFTSWSEKTKDRAIGATRRFIAWCRERGYNDVAELAERQLRSLLQPQITQVQPTEPQPLKPKTEEWRKVAEERVEETVKQLIRNYGLPTVRECLRAWSALQWICRAVVDLGAPVEVLLSNAQLVKMYIVVKALEELGVKLRWEMRRWLYISVDTARKVLKLPPREVHHRICMVWELVQYEVPRHEAQAQT